MASSSSPGSISTGQKSRGEAHLDPHIAAQDPVEQLAHAFHVPHEVDRLGIERPAARECQQLSGEPGPALDRLVHRVENALAALRVRLAVEHLQAAGDGHEQEFEIVRHPAGELPDRLHLLRLPQLLLRARERGRSRPLGGDVPAGGIDQLTFRCRDPGDQAPGPVPVSAAILERGQDRTRRLLQHGQRRGVVVRVDQVEQGGAGHPVGRPAEDGRPGRVAGAEYACRVQDQQQVPRIVPGPVALGDRLRHAGLERLVQAPQLLLAARALDEVGRLPRQHVQPAQGAFRRLMRLAPVRRDHAQ